MLQKARSALELGRRAAAKPCTVPRGEILQRRSYYGTVSERVLQALQAVLGEENVSTSESVREQHGRDESYHETLPAEAVLFPNSVEQVQEIARS